MPTANDIIRPALKLIGVIAQGETPSTSEADDARAALNAMVQNWMLEDLNMIPRSIQTISLAGASSYTLSPRPTRILGAQHNIATGISEPVKVMQAEEFSAIGTYGGNGRVTGVWYNQDQTTPTLYVAPAASTGTLQLYTLGTLPTFPDLVTDQTYPTGYTQALITSLALELAPMFGAQVTPALKLNADNAKAAIRTSNAGNPQPGGSVSGAEAR